MAIHIGTSGWSYDHWQGILYPHGTPVWERLRYYLQVANTVELNASFYRWPKLTAFQSWQRRLPNGFLFTVKAPRHLTHTKRLYAPEKWVHRIKESWHVLSDKRAVLLVQLSPNFPVDLARLHYFLTVVPPWIRLAFEFRHPSWHQDAVFQLLEEFGAAYCVMSGAALPCVLRSTAPFVYVRMHGPDPHHLYSGSYSDADLHWWSQRIREWEWQGKEVFVYFNNDGNGYALYNAERLRQFLS
ncbi:DUF72 domain-containing protein [Flavisolibacter sp. BT320]|nr:DUF72 domain-containing protein [Flavisolibacter longurius]